MSVLSGYSKYKRYILTSSGYKLCSHWTSSNTVHFDDGKTAQIKVGAINGITDSLTSTSSNVALSSKAGKSLQDQVTQLNTGIANKIISKDTYVSGITVPGKGTILKSLTVSNNIGYAVYTISLYCTDNYIVPHLINWSRNVDSNGNTTSYVINIALHNLYDGSRTASKCGAITTHVN
jgi:hypothetical protein